MKYRIALWLFVLSLLPTLASADTASADPDLQAIRAELDAMKVQYEQRIGRLEQRLEAAEQELAQQPVHSALSSQPVYAAAAPPAEASGGYASGSNQYNPAIGVILNGAARAYSNDPEDHSIPGFPAGGESGLADEGLTMGESEFVFTSNVDDWFYGQVTMAIEAEDGDFETSLEEAFLDTLNMPGGTALRFGRFYSSVGYLNNKHLHTWAFADQALPYSAFMGGQYGDDGLQARWLAPTDLYLELGAEVFRGSNYPAAGDADNGFGTKAVFAKFGGDVGMSNSWAAGVSWLGAKAKDRDSGDEDAPIEFSGDSDTYIADLVWKWAPNGNIRDRNLIFQAEYMWREENGDYLLPDGQFLPSMDNDASGWYAQLIYQWQPRWRVGLRMDGLQLDDGDRALAGSELDDLGDDPRRYSLMFDYSHSEFSRIRVQYNRDETGRSNSDQFTLQYIMSIGAHGGHEF